MVLTGIQHLGASLTYGKGRIIKARVATSPCWATQCFIILVAILETRSWLFKHCLAVTFANQAKRADQKAKFPMKSPPALFLTAHLKSCTVGRSWSRRSVLAPSQPGWRWGGLEHPLLPSCCGQSQPQVLVPETEEEEPDWGRSWLSWAPNKVSGVWGPVGPAAWKLQVQNKPSPSKQNSIRL